ncbi:MAG: hypothetical protein ABIO14_12080 [Aeromicrobium sp.]
MPNESTVSMAKDIRKFAIIQLVITVVFLALIFWMSGGTDADYPPIWLIVGLMAAIGIAAFFCERVWLTTPALDPAADPIENHKAALDIFTGQTVRKLIISETPLLLAVLSCFVFNRGGWPVLIAALPGLAVMAWEIYPHLRNTSRTAVILDSKGVDSRLVDNFLDA